MPDKSARRVERPEGGPQGERSESSRRNSKLDPGLRRGDDIFMVSLIKRFSLYRDIPRYGVAGILPPSTQESGTWRRSGVYLRLNLFLLRERVPGRHRPGPPKAQHARKRSGKRTAADVDSGERSHGGPPKGIGRRPHRADGPTLSGYRTEGRRSATRPPPHFFAHRDVGKPDIPDCALLHPGYAGSNSR